MCKEVTAMLKACDTASLVPSQLQLTNECTNESLLLDLSTGECSNTVTNAYKPTEMEALYVKEKYAISDRAYREMSSL